jgi:integrase
VPPDAFVLGALDGQVRHPERLSARFRHRLAQARQKLGADALPLVRLHDLRHCHASLLLRDGVPVKVVSERLGHASPDDHPDRVPARPAGTQREAAAKLAGLIFGS